MTTTSVVLLLCWVVFGMAWKLRRISDRYRPEQFLWNDCGGVLVICGVTDFAKSLRSKFFTDRLFGKTKKESERLVVVREHVLFSNNAGPQSRHFTGKWADTGCLPPTFWSARKEPRLFVPFASERLATYEEQETYLDRPPVVDIAPFAAERIADNIKHDLKLRIAEWVRRGKVSNAVTWTMGFSACGGIFMAFATTGSCIVRNEKAISEETVTFYTTEPGQSTVRETKAKRWEMNHALVNEDLIYHPDIRKGPVAQIQQLGGGISAVCIKSRNGDLDCGMADSSLGLTVGDIAYLRNAEALAWVKGNWVEIHRGRGSWFISESEALALRDHADYRIKEE